MTNRIKHYRKMAGLSQADATEAAGWRYQSRWSSYEIGARAPGVEEARTILRVLNDHGADCTFEDIFPAERTEASAE